MVVTEACDAYVKAVEDCGVKADCCCVDGDNVCKSEAGSGSVGTTGDEFFKADCGDGIKADGGDDVKADGEDCVVLENDRGVKSSGIDGVEYVDCSCGGCEGAGFDGVGV